MMQIIEVNFAAVIAEQQGYLDGGRMLIFEGEGQPSQGWRLTFSMRRPVAGNRVTEGDLTVVTPAGDALFGGLRLGTAEEVTDEEGSVGAVQMELHFDITGGDGDLGEAEGTADLAGTVAGEGEGSGGSFAGEGMLLTLRMTLDVAADLTAFRPEVVIPPNRPHDANIG